MPESHGVCVETDTLGLSVLYSVHAFELDRTGGSLNAISLNPSELCLSTRGRFCFPPFLAHARWSTSQGTQCTIF